MQAALAKNALGLSKLRAVCLEAQASRQTAWYVPVRCPKKCAAFRPVTVPSKRSALFVPHTPELSCLVVVANSVSLFASSAAVVACHLSWMLALLVLVASFG